jgi:raffinose/stachyose/melibiose transport system substrate-binding protein
MRQSKKYLLPILVATAFVAAACGGDDEAATEEPAAEATAAEATAAEATAAEATAEGTAAAEEPAASGEEVTLRVLVHQNPPMVAFMEQFNEEFQAANPNIKVDMSVVNAEDLNTVNQTRLTANDIDVTTISVSGLANPVQPYMTGVDPPAWQTLIDAGLLMDLSDQPFVKNYDPTAIADGGSFNGKVYALPLGRVSYSGMFVNLDLLAEVGVEVPTTWSELVAVCDAVKAAGKACMTAGGADGWPIFVGSYGLLGALYPDQAALVEGLWTGNLAWNDDQGKELFNRYQTYATEMLEEGVTGLAHDAAIVRYAAGDVAFAPTGVWQAPALEGAEPGFDWTYIPFPGSDNAADNQYLFGKYDQSWAVAGNTPNKEAAMAYLAAFSEPENYNAFANAVGFLPTQPTASLDSKLGAAVAPLLANYRVGYEQFYVGPSGAGQWANGGQAAQWFYNGDFTDPVAAADQAQADLSAGLG